MTLDVPAQILHFRFRFERQQRRWDGLSGAREGFLEIGGRLSKCAMGHRGRALVLVVERAGRCDRSVVRRQRRWERRERMVGTDIGGGGVEQPGSER